METYMNYFDFYGRLHDRPVTELRSFPCHNSFLFSGYASVLDIKLDKALIFEAWLRCQTTYGYNRHPDNKSVPLSSHDECVGMFMLEDISGAKDLYKKLERSRFQVCNLQDFKPAPIYKLNPLKVAADFYKLSKEENARKATWKYPYIAPVIFRNMFQHTYFYARCAGETVNPIHTAYFFLSSLSSIFLGNNSSRVMLGCKLLKLKQLVVDKQQLGQTLPEKLVTKIFNLRVDFVREVMEYFPTAHPIVVAAVKKGTV